MNAELPPESAAPPTPPVTPPAKGSSKSTLVVAGVAVLALASSGLLWQKLSSIQEHLARQSADAGAQAVEARTMARQAQDQARETAARQAVTDARISETTLQRSQLEDLMQSLSRSRDENLVVDIESSVRLAQQQAQLTGSVEPLLAALKTADDRVSRAAQPRLAPLQRAIARDTDRIKSASTTDTPGLLIKLDELVRQVDELPTVNAVVAASAVGAGTSASGPAASEWWQRWLDLVHQEARKLLRVSRIEQPEAALLSPEQTFFLRENLKLKLLNARLGLLARQLESSRTDLAAATAALNKYFDPSSRKTQNMATLLQQVQSQMKSAELPRVDETLAALATAAAGR
ncbi:uroporphyrin-3 C-methyltransferase [Rhodoferax ferrireducens]|uniref:Uroporphyrin-3 C-methyltransferase n=1 Tax=Rhodoferax ferrireducens TaxID=192843 RepID=A0ABU2C2K4_9BURK|nr:uroporphyrinogen-III C-methyltransferase [Rhodoferax ferrireducens]MDR7375558.1 uroporphyrin-3 C-methyltransferase [Rhodoferax ferrireducens]